LLLLVRPYPHLPPPPPHPFPTRRSSDLRTGSTSRNPKPAARPRLQTTRAARLCPCHHSRRRWTGDRGSSSCSRRATASQTSPPRSEEHTSELESRVDLVCRLLLEKKKKS